jgi:hypothetical protein
LEENFSLTPGLSRVLNVRPKKNRLNGFLFAHSASTALKRGVNEIGFPQGIFSVQNSCGILAKISVSVPVAR